MKIILIATHTILALKSFTFAQENQNTQSSTNLEKKSITKFAIRRNHDDVQLESEFDFTENRGSSDILSGALLSYERDFQADTEQFGFRGSAVYSHTSYSDDPTRNLLKFSDWGFTPSISLNKFDTTGDSVDDIDQLTFRLGGWFFFTGEKPFRYTQVSGFATYSTDTSFKKEVFAAELDISWGLDFGKLKTASTYGLGSENGLRCDYRLDFTLHGEFGSVVDAGDTAIEEAEFARIGPEAKLILTPAYGKGQQLPISLLLEYSQLWNLKGNNPNQDYFKATVQYKPDKQSDWAVQVEYEKGGLDLTREKVEKLTAGLSFTF